MLRDAQFLRGDDAHEVVAVAGEVREGLPEGIARVLPGQPVTELTRASVARVAVLLTAVEARAEQAVRVGQQGAGARERLIDVASERGALDAEHVLHLLSPLDQADQDPLVAVTLDQRRAGIAVAVDRALVGPGAPEDVGEVAGLARTVTVDLAVARGIRAPGFVVRCRQCGRCRRTARHRAGIASEREGLTVRAMGADPQGHGLAAVADEVGVVVLLGDRLGPRRRLDRAAMRRAPELRVQLQGQPSARMRRVRKAGLDRGGRRIPGAGQAPVPRRRHAEAAVPRGNAFALLQIGIAGDVVLGHRLDPAGGFGQEPAHALGARSLGA